MKAFSSWCLIVPLLLFFSGCTDPSAYAPAALDPEATVNIEEESLSPEIEVEESESSKYQVAPLKSPWPEEISRNELIGAALYESFEFFSKVPNDKCEYGYGVYMEDYFHEDHVALVESITERSVNLFCEEMNREIYVIGGKHEFVIETIAQYGLPSDPLGGVCGVPVGEVGSADWMVACAWDGDIVWIGNTLGTVRSGELKTDYWKVSTAIHEIMHLVQDQQFSSGPQGMPSRPDPRFRPVWLIEGGADFLADAVGQFFGIHEYSWTTPTDRTGARISLEQSSYLEKHEGRSSPSLGPIDYYVGQVASEYIVASVGFESYMKILSNMTENSGNFDKSFEEAVGIPLDDFYNKFEKMHKNLYDRKVIINE